MIWFITFKNVETSTRYPSPTYPLFAAIILVLQLLGLSMSGNSPWRTADTVEPPAESSNFSVRTTNPVDQSSQLGFPKLICRVKTVRSGHGARLLGRAEIATECLRSPRGAEIRFLGTDLVISPLRFAHPRVCVGLPDYAT